MQPCNIMPGLLPNLVQKSRNFRSEGSSPVLVPLLRAMKDRNDDHPILGTVNLIYKDVWQPWHDPLPRARCKPGTTDPGKGRQQLSAAKQPLHDRVRGRWAVLRSS